MLKRKLFESEWLKRFFRIVDYTTSMQQKHREALIL